MSHVLLVNPSSPFLVDARTFPPLGLLYLGAALEANGHTCSVVDLAFDTPLEGHSPDLIGIMCLTPHYPQMPQLMSRLRSLYPATPIAVGGPHFSTVPSDGARLGAEVTCKGDGEDMIVQIANGRWQRGEVLQSLGGITDVNRYPFPARHLLPIADYRYQISGERATTAITQRGCLVAGTQVMLSSGQQRPIESVKRGDRVLSYNPDTGKCESAPVRATWERKANDVWELKWEDGSMLRVTGEHPIWTKRGWVEVQHLETQRDYALLSSVPATILRAEESGADREVLPLQVQVGLAEDSSKYPMDDGWAFQTSSARFINDGNGAVKVLGPPTSSNQSRASNLIADKKRQPQSYEAPRGGSEGGGHTEIALGAKHIRFTESTMEIGTYAKALGTSHGPEAERIGAIAPRTIVGGSPNLPLRRRWSILDWPLRLWQAAKSRLRGCETQASDLTSWGVLALTESGLYRAKRLSWARLDSPCGVVSSTQDQGKETAAKETSLIWIRLVTKRFIGKDRVYNITVHPVHTYFANGIAVHNCPYECSFCCHWEGYRKVRLRHTDNIVAEIQAIKRMGFGAVMFYDDEFNINHKRTMEVCDAIKGEGIRWRAFIKANLFNYEQSRAFGDSGCWELCTGVESGSDAILQTISKKATVADNTRARRFCRDAGIRFKAFCMVGHPGESYETAYATRDWLIANAPDEFNISLYTPYLGTPVFDAPERYDLQFDKLDYSQSEFFYRGKPGEYQAHASTSALSGEELARLRDEIENEVRDKLGLPKQGSPMTFYNTARTPDCVQTTEVG